MLNFLLLLFLCYPSLLLTSNEFIYIRNKRQVSRIIDDDHCNEVKTICMNLNVQDDLSVLDCLLATNPERLKAITKECQNTIWNHSRALIQDTNVKNFLAPLCGSELEKVPCKVDSSENNHGQYLKCLISNIYEVEDPGCNQALLHLESLAFSDYKWIQKFLEHCTDDIRNLQCGRIDANDYSQKETLNCLQENIMVLKSEQCKNEVFRLSELQSNSIKLDAPLFIDCANDYSRYCSRFTLGKGRVIPCLMQKFLSDHSLIEKKCAQHLMRRQKLIAADFHVSKGLLRACKDDIKKGHCRRQNSNDKTVRLAQILLCLENLMRNGTRLDSDCTNEMIDHRRMLMEDYRLSPEIVNSCKNETQIYCKGYEIGGKTIHCLMNRALINGNSISPRLSEQCIIALEDLVKKTDVGENWSVDPVLHEACDPVVKIACKNVLSGNARIMNCLMDNLRSDLMTENCENALIEIQYFVSRDFKLDPQLYKACKQDASTRCHYFDPTESDKGPSYTSQVLSCLYRHAYQREDDRQISHECMKEIQRVMRQRAINVDLQPEIEEVCVRDLGAFCQEKFRKGEEVQCLQDNMENLEDKCHDAVEMFTEIEAQQVQLNPFISKYCSKIIESLCKAEQSDEDDGVMDCLIENKNHPLVKAKSNCRASIEHFQIISLKDFHLTYKFKVACKAHIMRLCGNRTRSKSEVVSCLSEHILNATIQKVKSSIPKDCRQQLKAQIFQQREKIILDPVLNKACAKDINKFCKEVPVENAQVLECLQTKKDLSANCNKEVFKIQKSELYDNSMDYALQTICAGTIELFCQKHEKNTILECLKLNRDEKGFNPKCRLIVMHRLMEQNLNNFLNPSLQKNCQYEISKYCKKDLINTVESNIGDTVVKCLKAPFKHAQLSPSCEKELLDILRDRALDVSLNPAVRAACKVELETICKFESDESGKVEECLKISFIHKNIPTSECKQEVANMIEESKTDIQVDPILQKACALDLLTLCNSIEQGNGRHIQCLKSVMQSKTQTLSSNCKSKLRERLEMYKYAALESIDDLTDLYLQVNSSPAKNYLVIMLFVMIGGIFFIGVFCGRTFRSNYRVLKNK